MSGSKNDKGAKPTTENEDESLDIVDEEGDESFPASDPPSHTPVSGTKKPSKPAG